MSPRLPQTLQMFRHPSWPTLADSRLAVMDSPPTMAMDDAFAGIAPAAQRRDPVAAPPGTLGQTAERRFALHDIADDCGRVHARDLLFRRDSMLQSSAKIDALDRVSAALANALLDGYAANSLPKGQLLVAMDEAALLSPIAQAVTPDIGAVLLQSDLTISTQVLMRVAQLRAGGVRFSIDGVTRTDDPRWLLAPYAETVRLHLDRTPPDALNALVARAEAEGLEVIGCGVQSMGGYQQLEHLVVTRLQGPFIASPLELIVPALPGCDPAVLRRVQLLQANRVSAQGMAVAISADPALVMRLQLLHRLYVGPRQEEPTSLVTLVKALNAGVLAAWLEILRRTACHGHQQQWAKAVRDQVEVYQRSLLCRSGAHDRDAVEASVWLFLRRLCSPAHYLKTLKYQR
ncbi:hypothetical protein CDN98_04090 [Roseateles terrae]|nr:hypothetical protein CDN98_04090 [Roseateles terrae]